MLSLVYLMDRLRTLFLIPTLLTLCGVIVPAACQEKQRRPSRYLIPKGYVGWVQIDFKVRDARLLPTEDGHYLFKFPPSGRLRTSSDIEYGSASGDDFYYYSGGERQRLEATMSGEGGMIWEQSNGSVQDGANNVTAIFEDLFVGTEEQFERCGDVRGDIKIGPLNEEAIKKCMEK
jgi:hypothetical protein